MPRSNKLFFFSGFGKEFSIRNLENDSIEFRAVLSEKSVKDSHSGLELLQGDFSDLRKEGKYQIEIDNIKSDPFCISEEVFKDTYLKSLHSFYFQRCGVELPEELAGVHSHAPCHVGHTPFHYTTELKGKKDVIGGWHDAGDYGRYIIPGALSCAVMLMGYQKYPERFAASELEIPEQGNGTPEFLSEIAFELRWMLKMQNLETGTYYGGVHYMVNSRDYTWDRPDHDRDQQYIYGISSRATACFAAICAMAYRSFRNVDNDFAEELLTAARRSWSFLLQYSPYPSEGFQRPEDTKTGGYCTFARDNKDDSDDILWAAAELWLSTGEGNFKDYLEQHSRGRLGRPGGLSWMHTGGFWQLELLINKQNHDFDTEGLENTWLKQCHKWLKLTAKNEFRTAMAPKDYQWGSNGELMTRALVLILIGQECGEAEFFNVALDQLHYLLGRNCHNMSFVTLLGKRWPLEIHHAHLGSQSLPPFPGLVAGGPNCELNDHLMEKHFTKKSPPACCYLDMLLSCASNENCILYNAPLIPVAAYFSGQE